MANYKTTMTVEKFLIGTYLTGLLNKIQEADQIVELEVTGEYYPGTSYPSYEDFDPESSMIQSIILTDPSGHRFEVLGDIGDEDYQDILEQFSDHCQGDLYSGRA